MKKYIRPNKESYILTFGNETYAEFCFSKDGRMTVKANMLQYCLSDQETTLFFQELSKFESYKRKQKFLKEQTLNGSKATKEDIIFLMSECKKARDECFAENVECEGECECEGDCHD